MNASPSTSRKKIKSQVDAVIYFFSKMDDEMIADLLFDDRRYQDMNLTMFMRKLGDLFATFEELGDRFLLEANRVEGSYKGTNVVALSFIGDRSHNFIDILFEVTEEGEILDMYEFEDPEADLELEDKEARLFLDNYALHDEDDDYEENDEEDNPFF